MHAFWGDGEIEIVVDHAGRLEWSAPLKRRTIPPLPLPHPTRTQAALEARESPYLSPAMKATVAMLESGARVKREALAATTELVSGRQNKRAGGMNCWDRIVYVCRHTHRSPFTAHHTRAQLEALEAKAPQVEEAEAAAAERQRELAQAFQGAQFAGLPDVQAPQRATKGLASASAGAGGGAGAKNK